MGQYLSLAKESSDRERAVKKIAEMALAADGKAVPLGVTQSIVVDEEERLYLLDALSKNWKHVPLEEQKNIMQELGSLSKKAGVAIRIVSFFKTWHCLICTRNAWICCKVATGNRTQCTTRPHPFLRIIAKVKCTNKSVPPSLGIVRRQRRRFGFNRMMHHRCHPRPSPPRHPLRQFFGRANFDRVNRLIDSTNVLRS